MQGPIGVFVHHNTLHAFEDLPFEQAVIEASQLFGAEPYMSEAAYRAELARGRIHLEDIDAVLDSEPDAIVFPRLSRRSLRRAMMTPGVREFDAATILWRTEQGDLAKDFRQPALRALFDACLARTVAHEEEPAHAESSGRDHPPVADPVVLGVSGSGHGLLAHAAPREGLLCERPDAARRSRGGIFPRYLTGLDEEFRAARAPWPSRQRMRFWITSTLSISMRPNGKASFRPSCWHCPAGRA